MQEIPRAQVRRRLETENPWWREPHEVSSIYAHWTPRPYLDLFLPLLLQRSIRRAIVLMGPRRVGKTVLIHHAVQRLLAQGVQPQRICYVSVDNPVYVGLSLERLLDLFSEATGTDYSNDECFVFFDEIQYLREWEKHLKVLVDSFPGLRCVASGSAAAALRLKSDESGAGRFTDFLLPPLTFHEYLALLGESHLVEIEDGQFHAPDIEALNQRFVHFLNFGGYPEVVFSPEIQADPGRFIKSDIIDKVLLRDLPSLYGIRDIQELNSLFTTLAFNTAREISLEQLANKSGVAKNTIKRYIDYLEAAFLIRTLHRVDRSARHFQRANFFKVYLTNPSIRTALFAPVESEDEEMGALAETGVLAHWFHWTWHEEFHYARWKEGEIDLVSLGSTGRARWGVEVKWSDRYSSRPALLAEILRFCQENNISKLVVTTRTEHRTEQMKGIDIDFQPVSLYCYEVGYNLVSVRAKRATSSRPEIDLPTDKS
jgi:predicted AAA+ superfamily ATPase